MIRTIVAPLLSVRGGARAIEFYQAAFAARVLNRIDDESGSVVAQMAVDTSEFWVADESPEHQNFSPQTLGGSTVRMIITVENPDEVFERAISVGGSVVSAMADQSYGWRVGRLVDPFGHHWEIGVPLTGAG